MRELRTPLIGVILFISFGLIEELPKINAQQRPPTSQRQGSFSQFGFKRSSTSNYASTFLTNPKKKIYTLPPPIQLPALLSEIPESIIPKYRLFMTTLKPKSTTPLRGDQEPPTEEYVYIQPVAYKPPKRVPSCEKSSCYPATGNLLIGRESRLYASSTCGTRGPSRFCIVSHLEEKKCFLCETNEYTVNDASLNHRIGQIIYKNKPGTRELTWWQSENGKENVTIQLDLEAEFHFTHLIIVFSTFRPAAMLIERSYDFGRTWHVYRYFAHDCDEYFPGVPRGAQNITDVNCDQRYSNVEPSKNGEVIFRVLPPSIPVENPYAPHIQNMLKVTNLRINFTKLHNLGDTLLDDREEIQEKYYYGISSMVVRGSCSCYGHASHCLPLEGVENAIDMVHGRCNCTHNTKGLNCEECLDFYNDLPWQPALGKQANACQKCNCNDHADSCHFDQAVYEHSGRVSGGVCDNCKHNTQGQHCEECIPFFYRDPREDIRSPYACLPCDCDPRGALDEGICDSLTDIQSGIEAGACHCKPNVLGRRCDTCKDGFWNLDPNNPEGCQNCTCNILGTIGNSGCNQHTGECECKRLVTGKDCNQCMPETFGLSDSQDGCQLCDCNPGGSLDNNCDVITGQCRCRPNMIGRTCSTPKQHHFVPSLHDIYEAELPRVATCDPHGGYDCTIVLRELPPGTKPTWTGPGFTRLNEGNELIFTIDNVPRSLPYDVLVRYQTTTPNDWEVARITVVRPDGVDPYGPCANTDPSYEDRVPFQLTQYGTSVVALPNVCLEKGKVYQVKLLFESQRRQERNPAAQILIDSLSIIPQIEASPIFSGTPAAEDRHRIYIESRCNDTYYELEYEHRATPECKELIDTAGIYIHNGSEFCNCNPTGSLSKKCIDFGGECPCKQNVVGRQCERCAPGTYGFGPEGCTACDCDSIGSTDNDCDVITGQCKCHPNTYGRECNQCQPGYWNFPHCQQCECNGHAQHCDSRTGECINCLDATAGHNCNHCIEGFYGNPLLGSDIGCRPCRCPDTFASNHTHADQCTLDPRTNDMICYCREGYAGARCDVCEENYFGNPEVPGGSCQKCECGSNINLSQGGNCDKRTGQCLRCLYDTAGDHCEYCRDGFYGNALTQQCQQCDCDVLGTNGTITYCDRYTGQCPCLPNVVGVRCDDCALNHWKIASGEGCEPCDCDPNGAEDEQCNKFDGQCTCKAAFGGRQCNECQTGFWGNPNEQCYQCECDPYGSATHQCNRSTGQCKCLEGIGGYKCDQCARGFIGNAPSCSPCGECFDNWDLILNNLREQTKRTIEQASEIKKVGATGAYTKEFDGMDKKLGQIQQLLDNTTISTNDINKIENLEKEIRQYLTRSSAKLEEDENQAKNLHTRIILSEAALSDLRSREENIKTIANDLRDNSTQLQEANIEGALNLTRLAFEKANQLTQQSVETKNLIENAELQCRRTEALVNRSLSEFNDLQQQNENNLDQYFKEVQDLTSKVPDLNNQLCDRHGDPCDSLCGGAGCGQCGGLSCEKGAVTRASKALELVKDAEKIIKEKEDLAEDIIRSLSQARLNASEAFKRAENAQLTASSYLNRTNSMIAEGNQLISNLTAILQNNTASPNEIRKVAEKTLALSLQLDPQEIRILADKIGQAVSQLGNVDNIIYETRNDLENVQNLKNLAGNASERADQILKSTKEVVKSLEEAKIAQEKAEDAIKKSNADIALARDDLNQIDDETVGAQRKAKETADKVDQLADQLSNLQKNNLKNDLDSKSIQRQSNQVREAANNAHDSATKLRNEYSQANQSLTEKANTSENARARAQQLLLRASQITVDTTNKLSKLQAMSETYLANDRELNDLQKRVEDLDYEITQHLATIQQKSEYYRQCTS